MEINISEKVIEDIFTIDKRIIAEILGYGVSDLSLIARQKNVKSGIIDLIYLWKDELILIELKTVSFYNGVVEQIERYSNDLLLLQSENKLIKASIKKIILVPSAKDIHHELCRQKNIKLIKYNPKTVLYRYYETFKELSQFLNLQAGDFGMVRLGLLNSTLKHLGNGHNPKTIAALENKSIKTIRNRISVAVLLNLSGKFNKGYYLTELGEKFNTANNIFDDQLNDEQKTLIQSFVKENPFYSSITYSIFSILESVFVLSKNTYPVPRYILKDYFIKSVGKTNTWVAEKSKETATYIFSNFAQELDFLAKVNNEFFITPSGIQAILLLQLNRSIKIIGSKQ